MSLTKLVEKNYSPLIIRKYTKWGFPLFVALITDDDLSDLDEKVLNFFKDEREVKNVQDARNICGALSDYLIKCYPKTEGVAVVAYFDKLMVSSLWGDFMNHTPCRLELYTLLIMMTNI